jgi:hypothetical protein
MKLRFEVDQAECFRRGIDCPKSIVTVEVDPKKLSQPERDLVADRLHGIDVLQLWNSDKGTEKMFTYDESSQEDRTRMQEGKPPVTPVRVIAKEPTFEGLMTAIRENQSEVDERQLRHRSLAMRMAVGGFDYEALNKEVAAEVPSQDKE